MASDNDSDVTFLILATVVLCVVTVVISLVKRWLL